MSSQQESSIANSYKIQLPPTECVCLEANESFKIEATFEGVEFIFTVTPTEENTDMNSESGYIAYYTLETIGIVLSAHVEITQETDEGERFVIFRDRVVGSKDITDSIWSKFDCLLDEWKPWDYRKPVNLELSLLKTVDKETLMLEQTVEFEYLNWQNKLATRRVRPVKGGIRFGSNEWHKEEQWLLTGIDVEKNVKREFAMKDIRNWRSLQN